MERHQAGHAGHYLWLWNHARTCGFSSWIAVWSDQDAVAGGPFASEWVADIQGHYREERVLSRLLCWQPSQSGQNINQAVLQISSDDCAAPLLRRKTPHVKSRSRQSSERAFYCFDWVVYSLSIRTIESLSNDVDTPSGRGTNRFPMDWPF